MLGDQIADGTDLNLADDEAAPQQAYWTRERLSNWNITVTRQAYWTCGRLSNWEGLFVPSSPLMDGTPLARCRLCGEVFVDPPNQDVRWHHVDYPHNLGQCPVGKKFQRQDHFRLHLQHSHNASTGCWQHLDIFRFTLADVDGSSDCAHYDTVSSFPCMLAPYGSQVALRSRDQWQRHVNRHFGMCSIHLWCCELCENHPDFYSDAEYLRHVNKCHSGCFGASEKIHGDVCHDGTLQNSSLEDPLRVPTEHLKCFFCDHVFEGQHAWKERLVHVGKHMEAASRAGEALVDPADWQVDEATEKYMALLGLIVQHGEHLLLADVVQDIKQKAAELERNKSQKRRRVQDDDSSPVRGSKRRALDASGTAQDPIGLGAHALLMSFWDAELLGQWHGKRDRINRWMLHSLGSDADQANVYRQVVQRHDGTPLQDQRPEHVPISARNLMKYWFTDEAALGTDGATASSITASGSMLPPSLMSSRLGLSSRL